MGWICTAPRFGDRYVVEHMRQHGFNVGGEQSGHLVLSDFGTTGDGLVAALQILACVKRQGKTVSEVCQPLRSRAAGLEECPGIGRHAA